MHWIAPDPFVYMPGSIYIFLALVNNIIDSFYGMIYFPIFKPAREMCLNLYTIVYSIVLIVSIDFNL